MSTSTACALNGGIDTPCPPSDSPTLVYSCAVYDDVNQMCTSYEWIEASVLKSKESGLDIHDPAVGQLIGAVALLFATAFVFNFLFKFILNKR